MALKLQDVVIIGVAVLVLTVISSPNTITHSSPSPAPQYQYQSQYQPQATPTGDPRDTGVRIDITPIVASANQYWSQQLTGYQPPGVSIHSGITPSACGPIHSPAAYCALDATVYLDQWMLETLKQLAGTHNTVDSAAFIVAHEIGHHVQNLLNLPRDYNFEHEADCASGAWAAYAMAQGMGVSQSGILAAAESVGSHNQASNHGSKATRRAKTLKGMEGGPSACF